MTPHEWIAVGILGLYLLLHHRSYRRHRRRGLSVRVAMRGPFHTTISKWFRI